MNAYYHLSLPIASSVVIILSSPSYPSVYINISLPHTCVCVLTPALPTSYPTRVCINPSFTPPNVYSPL